MIEKIKTHRNMIKRMPVLVEFYLLQKIEIQGLPMQLMKD
jgi:hypothetical protein